MKACPDVNTKKIGGYTTAHVLTYERQTRKISYTVEVKDIRKPTIKLKEDHITLEYGQKYDVVDNIKSVRDPTDGPLKEANKKATGSYRIDSKLNVLEAGSYTIIIHTQDLDGNSAEKKLTAIVEKGKSRS